MQRIGLVVLCALLLGAGCAVGGESSLAASQTPTVYDDSFGCRDLGFAEALHIDAEALVLGSWVLRSDGVIRVMLYSDDGVHFNWVASMGVDAVMAMGNFGSRIYFFDPESTGGSGLMAPRAVTGQPSSLRQVVFCYDQELQVSMTAEARFDRAYQWQIAKDTRMDHMVTLAPGQSMMMPYQVSVWATPIDANHAVTGDIAIHNPSATHAAEITAVTAIVWGGLPMPVTCPVALPYSLEPHGTLQCSYGEALPDANDRLNIVVVSTGPESEVAGGAATALVAFGDPGAEIDRCVDVDDVPYGPLGQTCERKVFHYEMQIGPFAQCGERIFYNWARFVAEDSYASDWDDAIVHISVPCLPSGCTRTPGYWKTHSYHGPAAADPTWDLLPGGVDGDFFLADMSRFEVLWTPTRGNAYFTLARAYLAARLNGLAGASLASVLTELADAEDFFEAYAPGDIEALSGNAPVRMQALHLAEVLDDFNHGLLGPEHCDEPESHHDCDHDHEGPDGHHHH